MKARRAFPDATREAEDALQERDPGFDARAEPPKFVVDPLAPHHVENGEAALFRETHVLDSEGLAVRQVVRRCEGAVKARLARHLPVERGLAADEGDGPRAVGRIAFRDGAVEDA